MVRAFKVIIFDIDNTLIYCLPRPVQTLLDFAVEQGLPVYPDALQRGERRNFAYYADGQADEERALFGESYFRRNYVKALLQAMCPSTSSGPCPSTSSGPCPSTALPWHCRSGQVRTGPSDDIIPWLDRAVARLDGTPRVTQCPRLVQKVVRSLHKAGYHLAALSNREGDLHPLLADYGLEACFGFTLSAGQAGIYKPNPEIFDIALRALGVSPAATLAVGDSYDADVVGAQRAGITAVLLDPMGIFPKAPCLTIQRLDQLVHWLITA